MFLPSGFDKAIASEAAALVLQAYEQYTAFKSGQPWSLQGNYQNLAVLSAKPEGLLAVTEPFGFVAQNLTSKALFVAFRGTQSIEDWISDFTARQVQHPWGNVEEGFANLYAQCTASVLNGVRAAQNVAGVYVTGHSLGASLAVLALADLEINRVAWGTKMYTFAGPRVGDIQFAAMFNQSRSGRAWRIVNTEDIVPTLPLATPDLLTVLPHGIWGTFLALKPKLNFEHVGEPVCFTENRGDIPGNHDMTLYQRELDAN